MSKFTFARSSMIPQTKLSLGIFNRKNHLTYALLLAMLLSRSEKWEQKKTFLRVRATKAFWCCFIEDWWWKLCYYCKRMKWKMDPSWNENSKEKYRLLHSWRVKWHEWENDTRQDSIWWKLIKMMNHLGSGA